MAILVACMLQNEAHYVNKLYIKVGADDRLSCAHTYASKLQQPPCPDGSSRAGYIAKASLQTQKFSLADQRFQTNL